MTVSRSRARVTSVLVSLVVLPPLLAGCSEAPWRQTAAGASPSGSATASPSTSPSATAKVQNDLAKGSTERVLSAGGVRLTVTYFSTLSMTRWTAAATKPLSVAATAAFADGSKQDIFLRDVTATVDVRGPDGPLAAPEAQSDSADVAPGYLVTSPSSYSQVFTLGGLAVGAESITVNFTYELLAESAPKSKTYLKQTASDTVVVALAEA